MDPINQIGCNDCPKCRKPLTRKRSYQTNDTNIIIANTVFTRNLAINAIVDDLNIKCHFHYNGCQQTFKFGSIASHLSECEYRICTKCNLTLGVDNRHNCLVALNSDRIQMKGKIKWLEEEVNNLKTKLSQKPNNDIFFRLID